MTMCCACVLVRVDCQIFDVTEPFGEDWKRCTWTSFHEILCRQIECCLVGRTYILVSVDR